MNKGGFEAVLRSLAFNKKQYNQVVMQIEAGSLFPNRHNLGIACG